MASAPKAVLFDAGMTLLEPVTAISSVYLEEAERLELVLDRAAFDAHMSACWRRMNAVGREAPDGDHASSDELERALWHRFTLAVAAPFPELGAVHEPWLEGLFRRFDAPETWR